MYAAKLRQQGMKRREEKNNSILFFVLDSCFGISERSLRPCKKNCYGTQGNLTRHRISVQLPKSIDHCEDVVKTKGTEVFTHLDVI